MNSKLLFAATIAVSLLSTWAMAAEAQVTRAQVNADVRQAIATHTLQRTDYDVAPRGAEAALTKTRAQVQAELIADNADRARLVGPNANRTFNPVGTQVLEPATLTRADVKTDALQAAAAGTLRRSDYDGRPAAAQSVNARAAAQTLAQRVKAVFTGRQAQG